MAKKAATARKRQREMSEEHKAALAEGREQGRVVRRYLEALESQRLKRGRRRTPESIRTRLAGIEEQLASADALSRVHLLQDRMNLQRELATAGGEGDGLEELEAGFIEVAAAYGERQGLTYQAWRSIGVAPRVLKAAGIARTQ